MGAWDNPIPAVYPPDEKTLRVIFASLENWSEQTFANGYYGAFFDTLTQGFTTLGTPQVVTINSEHESNGVSIASGSRITLEHAGTYNLTALIQIENRDNVQHDAHFWLKLNGTNYANSAVYVSLPARKSSTEYTFGTVTLSFTGTALNDGDYVEIWWLADSTNVRLNATAAGTSPSYPYGPPVIVSVTQVASTIQGPQGAVGAVGPQGPQGAQGPQGLVYDIDGGDAYSVYGGTTGIDAGTA